MPTLEFEVFCGTCNYGLCKNTTTKRDSVYVDVCPSCMKEKQDRIAELEEEVSNLEEEIVNLENRIEELEEE